MKKQITFFFFLLLSCTAIFAQDFRFGLAANPLISWFRIDNPDLEGNGPRAGVNFGLIMEYGLGDIDRYSLSTGLFLTNLGGNYKWEMANKTFEQRIKLQYIDIPVRVKLKTNEVNYMTWFGQVGLIPSINIRARGDLDVSPETSPPSSFVNEKLDRVNLFNISLNIGAGLEYAISESTSLQGGIFYNNGFVNLVDDDDEDKITLLNIGLMVGVLF